MRISLTDKEISAVISACTQYVEIMGEGEDTYEYTEYELETGLGSALKKIGKGRNISKVYSNYKTRRKYPTFEEWKSSKVESEVKE